MAEIKIPLMHSVEIGGEKKQFIILKELTPGDIIEAGLASEKPVPMEEGITIAVSPTLMGINTLMRQIKAIGDYDGAVTMDILTRFHREDFEFIQMRAEQLDMAVLEAVQKRGRSDSAGGESGNHDNPV